MKKVETIGEKIYQLAKRLFPICRSITGDGVRKTLAIIKEYIPELIVHEIPSGLLFLTGQFQRNGILKKHILKMKMGSESLILLKIIFI